VDFGFGVVFQWPQWAYVWVSMAAVGLTLGFNGSSGFGFGSPLLPIASYFCGFC
jgi:hypothetical protein